MEQKNKKAKNDIIKSMIQSWKKMNSEKRLILIIILLVVLLVFFLPKIYTGWVNFRDNGFHFGSNSNRKDQENKTLTCSFQMKEEDYETNIQNISYYINDQLKKEEYTITLKSFSDTGKEELKSRKSLYEGMANSYKPYEGFTTNVTLKKDILTYRLESDYTKIDLEKINTDAENDGIALELELDQDMDSVKVYYESLGFTCK